MTHFSRIEKLIRGSIEKLQLDLRDTTILTEAATGYYFVTPIIAAMSGANVITVAKSSNYGTAEAAFENVKRISDYFSVSNKILFTKSLISADIYRSDIITNLGFVRHINKSFIDSMHEKAVISLFCEPWEVRPEDIDLTYCKKKQVPVLGTNEDAPNLDVFKNTAPLILKMITETGLEIYKNNFILLSGDKFGDVIEISLLRNGANLKRINPASTKIDLNTFKRLDALIIADYTFNGTIIGQNGLINLEKLKDSFPEAKIIHLSGNVSSKEIEQNKINYFPPKDGFAYRMSKTFSYLGPKPVIDLHTAGLKVGDLLFQAHKTSSNYSETIMSALTNPLCQKV